MTRDPGKTSHNQGGILNVQTLSLPGIKATPLVLTKVVLAVKDHRPVWPKAQRIPARLHELAAPF